MPKALFNGSLNRHIGRKEINYMPLPHFLLLILMVIIAAAFTLWISFSAGVPLVALLLPALMAAAAMHLTIRKNQDMDS